MSVGLLRLGTPGPGPAHRLFSFPQVRLAGSSTALDPTRPAPALTHYELLGLTPDATTTEIREAFFRQAKALHPDRNPDPNARQAFMQIQEAYKVLRHAPQRAEYNQTEGIEKSLHQRTEDLEVAWTTRKTVFGARPWSEKLAKDLMRASSLRSIRRHGAAHMRGQPVDTLEDFVRRKGSPRQVAGLKQDLFEEPHSRAHEIYKIKVMAGVSVGLFGVYYASVLFLQNQGVPHTVL
ncbi:hypothetical protein TCAL_06469 [Tigriopus californicus]|uniref:J domain-containing protein n=1 Tax=Tigriopus californicus TaxID=6832 RepID=A0A553PJU4_TIGCA|nr:uncharacterized protein LOC131890266 [Tigriopus californicus]TRY77954.1 hypothetical protein TCAL_06469 [Tigriopus californicus]|eukprot:TCALIF_06469-PA protein Name:"Similar to dnaJ Chaperone protein DnaJ (Mycoplasma penetrans (strain HF-2))" AED:0.03 eAED:0.11 QI:0/-1/0/1/-1/1/1/0/235